MNKKRILDILIVILLGIMLFSGYKLYTNYIDAKHSKEQYHQLEEIVNQQAEAKELTAYEKYKEIYQQNNDFIGWIYIPDTALSYPVMHTPKIPEYYLRRDFNGKYSIAGVPFMDHKCTVDQSDITIIYGHNMMNGTMFSIIEDYMKQSYWQEHRYIGFDTMNGYGIYEVAICAKVDLQEDQFNYIESVDFASQEEFDFYIAQFMELSRFDTGVQLSYGDKLLLISTCETNYEDGRCVVIAKKVSDENLSTSYLRY